MSAEAWTPAVAGNIAAMPAYVPGTSLEQAQRESGLRELCKLASNEHPAAPSPLAVQAMQQALLAANRYPDASHHALKQDLARQLGCEPGMLAIGNGSTELIDLCIRVLVPRNEAVLTHQAAFIAYRQFAQLHGCQCIEAPIRKDLSVDVEALLDRLTPTTRLVCLANPNNPTGRAIGAAELDHLARELNRRRVLLLLDYAYWEYVTDPAVPDPNTLFQRHPNVLILRTFSKAHALAAVRVGYLLARPAVIALIERARPPFSVSTIAIEGARATLHDAAHLAATVAANAASRRQIEQFLLDTPFPVTPGQGNFLLVDFLQDAAVLYQRFLQQGVILRPVGNYGLPTHLRISCGSDDDNRRLFAAMRALFPGLVGGPRQVH